MLHRFFKAILLLTTLVCVVSAAAFSTFPLHIRNWTGSTKMLGVNLIENYDLSEFRDEKNILDNVYYYYRYQDSYDLKKSLSKVVSLGSNTVVLCPALWMHSGTDTEIFYDQRMTQGLKESILEAKKMGLKVILRPMIHLMSLETKKDWRGTINPEDANYQPQWDLWFKNYTALSEMLLGIAEETGADVYVVGVELLSSTGDMTHWNTLLLKLKSINQKSNKQLKFAYDALYPREFDNIMSMTENDGPGFLEFFKNIDYLGINFYPPLLSVVQYGEYEKAVSESIRLNAGRISEKIDFLNNLLNSRGSKHKLYSVISEFGLKSSRWASISPWMHPTDTDELDFQEQASALNNGIRELGNFSNIKGILVWATYVDPYYGIPNFIGRSKIRNGDNSFSIVGKPAEIEVQKNFYALAGLYWTRFFEYTANILYICGAFCIFIFGLHRLFLIKKAGKLPSIEVPEVYDTPTVTIQIPIYNEPNVIARMLESVTQLDYPADKLDIQVLDDSSDNTPEIVEAALKELPGNLDISHIRRADRIGYKAGALANGLIHAKGDFIAIFDADFLPQPGFLRELLPYFANPQVGLVQARWGFLNSQKSFLTSIQELFLGGHFRIDHIARFNNGCYFNFNGTAGIFRKDCIVDSGGWEHDSLTEDLDLSYRAQIRDWKFIPVYGCVVPSELPEKMLDYKRQQHRWVKGSVQVSKKLLPRILFSKLPFKIKLESVFHLTSNSLYLFVFLLALNLLPVINSRLIYNKWNAWVIDLPLLLSGTFIMFIFYLFAEKDHNKSAFSTIARTFLGMIVSIGMSLNNTIAFLEGLFGISSGFVRTPKKGEGSGQVEWVKIPYSDILLNLIEWTMCLHAYFAISKAAEYQMWVSIPFAGLFFLGFFYVAIHSLYEIVINIKRSLYKKLRSNVMDQLSSPNLPA